MTTILGIDHATISAGYAIFDGTRFHDIGVIHLPDFSGTPPYVLFTHTEELIDCHKPDLIALEKPMSNRNGDTTRKLTEAYMGAKLAAECHGVEVVEVTPKIAKMYTAGHGEAEKIDVARALVAQFKLDMDTIAPPVYYKRDSKRYKKGQLRERLYDPSDAAALCVAAWQIRKSEAIGAMVK